MEIENNTATFTFDGGNLELLGKTEADTTDISIEDIVVDEIELNGEAPVEEGESEVEDNKNLNEETPNEQEVVEPIFQNNSSQYKDVLKNLGIGSFMEVTEDGEEVEKNVDETDLDIETVVTLIKNAHQQELDDYKASSISIENVDNDRKEVVDFIIKGGDPKKLIEFQSEIASVREYDYDNPEDAEELIRKYYSYREGTTKEEVDAFIIGVKAQDKLSETAETASHKITEHVEKLKQAEKEHLEGLVKKNETALKEYTKEFKTKVKEAGYTDKHYNKLVDFATKKVKKTFDDGRTIEGYEMDFAIQAMRSNPEQATKLAMLILDEEAYIKKLMEQKEIELKKKTIKDTRTVRVMRSNSVDTTKTNFEKNASAGNLLALD